MQDDEPIIGPTITYEKETLDAQWFDVHKQERATPGGATMICAGKQYIVRELDVYDTYPIVILDDLNLVLVLSKTFGVIP
jgi:hypothetical protein